MFSFLFLLLYAISFPAIVGIFEKRGLVRQVDGMRSVDEVFADIQKLFA
jgi:hypothetical protein